MARVRIDVEANASQAKSELSGLGQVASGIGKGMLGVAGAAAAAVTAVAGFSLVKGFQRLESIDQATAKLTGLGHSAEDVKGIMDNALASVQGTAFGLGEAAGVAATAVAAGVKPGQELERTLKLVADTATIAQVPMGEIGQIFNKVAASGKLTGESLAQLQDRGIPVIQMLADSLGKTPAEIQKMVSAGQIGFAEFQDAMQKGLGGAALESGKTFSGALANVQAALGRLGAGVLGPTFQSLAPLLNSLIPVFDQMGTAAGAIGMQLVQAFQPIAGIIGPVVAMLGQSLLGAVQTLAPAFARLFAAAAPLIPILVQLAGTALQAFADAALLVLDAVTPLLPTIIELARQFASSLAPALPALAQSSAALAQALLPLVPSLLQLVIALTPLIVVAANVAAAWSQMTASMLSAVVGPLSAIIGFIANVVGAIIGWFASLSNTLVGHSIIPDMISAIVGLFLSLPGSVIGAISSMVGGVIGAVSNMAGNVTNAIRGMASGMISGVQSGVGGVLGALGGLAGSIGSALSGLAGAAFSAGASIMNSLANGIRSAIGSAFQALSDAAARLRSLLPSSPAKTGPFSGRGYPLYSGMAIADSLAAGLRARSSNVTDAMNSMLGTGSMSLASPSAGGWQLDAGRGTYFDVTVLVDGTELRSQARIEAQGVLGQQTRRAAMGVRYG